MPTTLAAIRDPIRQPSGSPIHPHASGIRCVCPHRGLEQGAIASWGQTAVVSGVCFASSWHVPPVGAAAVAVGVGSA
eukprot:1598256-Prymnesium_polylepis.1